MDKQTLSDLEIFGSPNGQDGLFDFLDRTKTLKGRIKLKNRFQNPLVDLDGIMLTQIALKNILKNLTAWDELLEEKRLVHIDDYLVSYFTANRPTNIFANFIDGVEYKLMYRSAYSTIRKGVRLFTGFLNQLYLNITTLGNSTSSELLNDWITQTLETIELIKPGLETFNDKSAWILKTDYEIRVKKRKNVFLLLDLLAELDALLAMAKMTKDLNLSFPEMSNDSDLDLEIIDLYHPLLENGITNSIKLNRQQNIVFLTGPNMAGKTTFLKASTTCVYLAHLGVGVPAKRASIPVFDSIITGINTTDDLNAGYSYFFVEVNRIKFLAEKLNKGHRVFIVFDELFKGTNIKDAFDCTKTVINGLCDWESSLAIISSHLLELADDLNPKIDLKYFEVLTENEIPYFTYLLKEGVSNTRLGKYILEKANIPQLLSKNLNIPKV